MQLLKQSEDATRIAQKFLLGKGDPEDLLAIRDSIRIWNQIRGVTESELDGATASIDHASFSESEKEDRDVLRSAIRAIVDLQNLAEKIDMAVDESVAAKKEKVIAGGDVEDTDAEVVPEVEDGHAAPQMMSFGGASRPWSIKPQSVRT